MALIAGYVAKHSAATAAEHRFVALALFGYTTFRHFSSRSTETSPTRRSITNCAFYGQSMKSSLTAAARPAGSRSGIEPHCLSNKIADHLLPHLNLQNITTWRSSIRGLFRRRSITSCMRSHVPQPGRAAHTNFHYSRSGCEVLVNKKLKQAQRLYEKNQRGG